MQRQAGSADPCMDDLERKSDRCVVESLQRVTTSVGFDSQELIFRIVLGRSARLAIRPALDEAGFSALPMKMLVGMD